MDNAGSIGRNPVDSAVRLADNIRNRFLNTGTNNEETASTESSSSAAPREQQQNQQPSIPPGLVEGTIIGLVTFGALNPFRKMLLRKLPTSSSSSLSSSSKQVNIVTDMILFVSQAMVSSNVAMYTGVLYGTNVWLSKFAKLTDERNNQLLAEQQQQQQQKPQHAAAITGAIVNDICTDDFVQELSNSLPPPPSTEIASWYPTEIITNNLYEVIKHCNTYSRLQNDSKKQE